MRKFDQFVSTMINAVQVDLGKLQLIQNQPLLVVLRLQRGGQNELGHSSPTHFEDHLGMCGLNLSVKIELGNISPTHYKDHFGLSVLCCATALCYCAVLLRCATALCYCTVLLHCAIMLCYCTVLLCCATALCYCVVLLHCAIVLCN